MKQFLVLFGIFLIFAVGTLNIPPEFDDHSQDIELAMVLPSSFSWVATPATKAVFKSFYGSKSPELIRKSKSNFSPETIAHEFS
jgi:hypothetical protein